jgi:hypothetical protein
VPIFCDIETCEGQISVSENGMGELDFEKRESYNLVVMVPIFLI